MGRPSEFTNTYGFSNPLLNSLWRSEVARMLGLSSIEVIMKYIEQQGHEPPDADFKIEGNDL